MREPIQYDEVTGLPERGHLWSLLDDSLKMVRRNKMNAGVLLIKLNDLSNITDSLGQSSANCIPSDQVGLIKGIAYESVFVSS